MIINQTTQDKQLESDLSNVRVINAFELGLSKSRNLALQHSTADIVLFADDDVEYVPDVLQIVEKAPSLIHFLIY